MGTGNPWIVDPARTDAERQIDLGEHVGPDGVARALWIRVKTLLSIGEQRKMLKSVSTVSQPVATRGAKQGDAEAKLDWTEYSFARMAAYITDWSIAHETEPSYRLPATRASYEKLRQDVFEVIDAALNAHEAEAEAEKKAPASSPSPGETSA